MGGKNASVKFLVKTCQVELLKASSSFRGELNIKVGATKS